jgi:putative restriction endonuclease
MTPLKRALIEKAGHDHGFEHTLSDTGAAVTLGSARHPAKAEVSWAQQGYAMALVQGQATLPSELARSFTDWPRAGDAYVVNTDAQLDQWLRRASALAQQVLAPSPRPVPSGKCFIGLRLILL